MAETDRPILLVCGLGRCGSSLVMQMLKAGGLRVPGVHPYHEIIGEDKERYKLTWRDEFDAVKWLNPARQGKGPMPDRLYRCLWLTRDHFEQAKSWIKLSTEARGKGPDNHLEAILKTMVNLRKQEQGGKDLVQTVSCEPVPVLRFETILQSPQKAAHGLHVWADRPLDVSAMESAVKARQPQCAPTMLEGGLPSDFQG